MINNKNNANNILLFIFLRFDSYFLLDYLYQQDIRPELVMRGSKILSMKAESLGVRVIDSLSYMQMSLRVSDRLCVCVCVATNPLLTV